MCQILDNQTETERFGQRLLGDKEGIGPLKSIEICLKGSTALIKLIEFGL